MNAQGDLPPSLTTLEEHIWALAELDRPIRVSEARALITEIRALIERLEEERYEAEIQAWWDGRDAGYDGL